MIPVITIDGPSGSGKGTIAQRLAIQLGWHYLDSGVLYRVLALAAKRHGVAYDNETALAALARHLDVQFNTDVGQAAKITFEGEEVNHLIRSEEMGNGASQVSRFQAVRTALLDRQFAFREEPGLVTDGRDMGTIVFPDAIVKFFMLASVEERAKRRCYQLQAQGLNDGDISAKLADFVKALTERDVRDKERSVAPLVPAKDAVIIDTTGLSIEEVMAKVLKEVKFHLY
jgi:cytidylate kinase